MFITEELFSVHGQQKCENSTWYPNTLVVIKVLRATLPNHRVRGGTRTEKWTP